MTCTEIKVLHALNIVQLYTNIHKHLATQKKIISKHIVIIARQENMRRGTPIFIDIMKT